MSTFTDVFFNIMQPYHLICVAGGVLIGILVGVMPGLSSVMGMSVTLPLTLSLDGYVGILMMLGIFCGAIYGGSITAILINTPGTANSAATCLDGHPMVTKLKQPGRALGISTTASLCGGLFSAFVLLWTAPLLAKVALKFSAPEYFALGVFGLSIVTSVSSKSIWKGILGAFLGLFLSTIGMDTINGSYRFTFDRIYLTGGINFVPVLIGLFALSQGLITVEEQFGKAKEKVKGKLERVLPTKADLKSIWGTILRSSILGSVIGAIPGTGGDIASWIGYNEAKRWSKHPEKFGEGVPEGIAAPEAANNAVCGGALIPLLTLGIPGDACTAIMLGALMVQGIVPGPLLFVEQTDKVYTIIIGLFLANIAMGLLGYLGIRVFSKIVNVPNKLMVPIIFVFCFVGTYALNNNINDVFLMIIAGFVGFFLLKLDFSIPPIILGMILGKTIENNFRRSLVMSNGNPMIFFQHPISLALLVIAFAAVFYPFFQPAIKRKLAAARRKKKEDGEGSL